MFLILLGLELLLITTGHVLWEWFTGIKDTTLYVLSIVDVIGWVVWIFYYLKYQRLERSKKAEQEINLKNPDPQSLK